VQAAQPGPDPAERARVTVLGCASQPPHHLVAVTTLSRPPNLRELTPVQLQILGLLVKAGPTPKSAPPGATAARRPSGCGYHSASRGPDHDASADQPASAP
jgi:hypothetical protein